LVPRAVRCLEEHLDRGPAQVANDVVLPDNADAVRSLSRREMQIVAAKLVAEIPPTDTITTTTPVITDGGTAVT
jgi:hypothetical protein